MAVRLAPGADALRTAELVRAEVARQARNFPAGYRYTFPQDSTDFVRLSIEEVVKTLIEAIVLVVIVMFVFLQSWRATLIPAIAVPVVLLGTFGVLAVFGFSINTLTLFGMVLAIGLLVDDAIVVVENVERVMREQPGISAREATIQSMGEIQTALIAIALVLSAVFLPMAFFGGSVGEIYRQFSITMVAAMTLSVVVALVLTPALTAMLLQPHDAELEARRAAVTQALHRLGQRFSAGFERLAERYRKTVGWVLDHSLPALLLYAVLVGLLVVIFLRLPTSFLPAEDQGRAQLQYTLPSGATYPRTLQAVREIENYFMTEESADVPVVFAIVGQSQAAPARMPVAASSRWRPGTSARARHIAPRPSRSAPPPRSARACAMSSSSRSIRRRCAGWGSPAASPWNCSTPAGFRVSSSRPRATICSARHAPIRCSPMCARTPSRTRQP